MAQRNGEDDSTTSFPTPAFLGPSHRSKAPPPAPRAQGPLGGTPALPLPLAAGERKRGMQGGERGYGWTANLKTSSRRTGLLQPPLPPDACNAKRVPPWQGRPSSTRLLWGTHSGTEGQKPKAESLGRYAKTGDRSALGKSGAPKATYQPQPTTQDGLPPPPCRRPGPALTCRPGTTWRLSRRGFFLPLLSGIFSILGRSERKRHWGLFLLPLPPRTSAPRGRGANAAVTASH